jgi:hypothetical protein
MVTEGEQMNLAILNTDDNTHGFVMKQFGVAKLPERRAATKESYIEAAAKKVA